MEHVFWGDSHKKQTLKVMFCSSKMEEDSHQAEVEDLPRASSQPLEPLQLSRETLYKQRQKCELRRLLKHTHPELKMVDDFVDEELAEVWSSEEVAAGETGYEGEVLTRRLIFENRALGDNALPSTLKIQTAQGGGERCDFNKTVLEPQTERILEDDTSFNANLELKKYSEEDLKRIDVQATRRIFENQSQSISRPNQDGSQGKVSMFGDEGSILEKQNKQSECKEREHSGDKSSTNNMEEQLQVSCNDAVAQRSGLSSHEVVCSGGTLTEQESFSDSGSQGKMIKTSAALFLNNPFISGNVEQQKSFDSESLNHQSVGAEDGLTVNVKNRTSLFESMPFDKIRHQNKEEVETLVENIKETLSFLFHVKAIHSSGAIIEVNETMKAKRAPFLLSDSGPQIDYDDVTEGGAQNLILQLLPRTNLKPQITYLKEDREGHMQAMVVDVPHHQHQFSANRDTEFKTANMLQLVEDILNQDNSLRKGLIVQEDANNFTEVVLYSLYKYFDEQDVKSYIPPQTSDKESVETIDDSLKDQQICAELDMHGVKGNVKLFKDCIEKGDFEYLKTLQAGSAVQEEECSENQKLAGHNGDQVDESNTEWVPVDIKKLKSMFSKDKTNVQGAHMSSAHVSNVSFAKSQSPEINTREGSSVEVKNECGSLAQEEAFCSVVPQSGEQVDVNQATLMEELNTAQQVSTLQNAIHDLQQATIEAKLLYQSLQETKKIQLQEFSDKADVEPLGNLSQDVGQKVESCTAAGSHECLPLNIITRQDEMTKTDHDDEKSEKGQIYEARNKKDQVDDVILKQDDQADVTLESSSRVSPSMDEEQEAVLQGKMQAALESLERSNINVTRGDFRAAMIYRNSHKPCQAKRQEQEKEKVVTDSKLAQAPLKQGALVENSPHDANNKMKGQTDPASRKSKKSSGPKPAIPPKPQHLKQNQSTTPKKSNETQNKKTRNKKLTSQSPKIPQVSILDENKQSRPNDRSKEHQRHEVLNEPVMFQQTKIDPVQSSAIASESNQTDNTITTGRPEMNPAVEKHSSQNATGEDNRNKTDKNQTDLKGASQDSGGKKEFSLKTAPPKPKRLKIFQTEDKVNDSKPAQSNVDPSPDTCRLIEIKKDEQEAEVKQEGKVEMREKAEQIQAEENCRERLDEIVRGNITAAMEIFDNLQKQEQLQSILSRVEEIEKDTSEVDVRALRRAFESVPDWVVRPDKRKEKNREAENKDKRPAVPREKTDSSSSMAHVYGDLERASAEIMNLKEQTIARLLDIEDAIRKALYSVSTLKSDSDIASLSCLLRESFGQKTSPAGRTWSQGANESYNTREIPVETSSASHQQSPPSTPSSIAIQSQETRLCPTCQQNSKEEKFRSAKTLICNSPAQDRRMNGSKSGQNPDTPISNREVSVLEVQTDRDGNGVAANSNHEKTNGSGTHFYSSKTVMATQPESINATSQAVFSPSTHQVSTYPEVQLPRNQISTFKPQ